MKILLKIAMVVSAVVLSCNFVNSQNVISLKNGGNIYFTSIDTTGDYIVYTTDSLANDKMKISKKQVSAVINNRIITDYSKWPEMPQTGNRVSINNMPKTETPLNSKIVLDYSEPLSLSLKNQRDYANVFAEYSEAAYFKYRRGLNVLETGKNCLISAGVVFGVGCIMSGACYAKSTKSYSARNLSTVAIVIESITIAATTVLLEVGIPLVCVGKARIRKSFELYNIDYNKAHAQNGLSLNVGYTGTGLSLALNF